MKYTYFFSFLLFFSCNSNKLETDVANLQKELASAKEKISQLQAEIEPEGKLVHLVFFKVKDDADQSVLVAEIKKLENIEEVMDLEVGPFENLGDPRALADYTMLLQMSFADKKAYEHYQTHPIHLALKKNTGQFMAGPPATYDFIKK